MIPETTITRGDYAVFGIYLAASVGIGFLAGGKQRDLKTFLLAGHQMHWSLVAISILSSLFSGISFLGAPAESFNHNLVYIWVLVAYFIATPITTLLFLPFFYRLNFYTAYEYLEHRFDRGLRKLSSASFIFRASLWLGLALYAPSLVISEMMGIPLWASILLTGICTTAYTTFGGMRAVIYTDVMQFLVLIGGIMAIFYMVVQKTPGGFEGAWQIASEGGRTKLFDFSLSPSARMTVWGALIGGVFLNLVQLVTDQISVQRYLTASSLKEAKKALWFKLILSLPLISIFYLTGVVLYSFYQTHPEMAATLSSPDRLLPNFASRQLPSPFPGLLVAAILAATMSTVAAGLNSLTTATIMDFFIREKAGSPGEERHRVWTARLWTLFYGFATTGLALVVSRLGTILEASAKIGGFLGGPLLGVFCLGVLSSRANARGTLIGALLGFASVVSVGFFSAVSFMWYAMIGCIVTYVAGEATSRLFLPPSAAQRRFSLKPESAEKPLPEPAGLKP